ncbi:chaperonin 10-like protein [Bisporella sp. PMI_857]|nr:chaperonin 10-like protein [Bisporella sp. PMI_857]
MKGVIVSKAGGGFEVVDNLSKPVPGPRQVLVKSLATAINPVDPLMQTSGILVTEWPIVLGCDASGEVIEVGDEVSKFKVGDGVFGCTRLGIPGYSTFQEYFLMDEKLAFKRPGNISVSEAATIGVGLLTASLGLITGTNIEPKERSEADEWIVILGATGSVGQFAVQISRLCGFKVLASCSPSNDDVVKKVGAGATFSHKLPLDEQIKAIGEITKGNFLRVFDASGLASETGMAALTAFTSPSGKQKFFSTTNDWAPISPQQGIEIYQVTLGDIGRTGSTRIDQVNENITALIPELEKSIENGDLKPMEYEFLDGIDLEPILKGLDGFQNRKSDGRKLVVRVTPN